MTPVVGNRVFYPGQGPCIINSIVTRAVGDEQLTFYRLLVLDENGGDLFVPVAKLPSLGIRPLLSVSEIPRLFERLGTQGLVAEDFKQRSCDNRKLLATGSAFDLAEIVESLTQRSETKPLSFGDSKMLEKAKKLLVSEVAEVMGLSHEQAEASINAALSARRVAAIEGTAAGSC